MSKLSRRSLVTTAAALPALAVPAVAEEEVSAPDPIFALIEQHQQASTAWVVDLKAGINDPSFCDTSNRLIETIIATKPTTVAGCAAVLRYIDKEGEAYGLKFNDSVTDKCFMATVASALEKILRV
jgi:hypothetical protein